MKKKTKNKDAGGITEPGKKKKAGKEESAAQAQGEPATPAIEITEDRYLRLQADFENFKKRVLREKSEIYQRANESIMEDLLPVLDHMDLALDAAGHLPEGDSFVEGIKLVADQLVAVLAKHGLKVINAEGHEFDPNVHEAVSHIPSNEVGENIVITQLRRGYWLGNLLLRPAQVVVSSGSGEETAGPADETVEISLDPTEEEMNGDS